MTLAEFRDSIYKKLGKDANDTVAVAVVDEAINFAVLLTSLIFKPKELEVSASLNISLGTNYTSLSGVTWVDILRLFNTQTERDLHFIPFELWKNLIPPSASLKFYTRFGDLIYLNQPASADISLDLFYITSPATLSLANSSPEFSNHNPYILATATAISFAAFEENESANLWMTVQNLLNGPYQLSQAAQETVSGRFASLESKFFQMGK